MKLFLDVFLCFFSPLGFCGVADRLCRLFNVVCFIARLSLFLLLFVSSHFKKFEDSFEKVHVLLNLTSLCGYVAHVSSLDPRCNPAGTLVHLTSQALCVKAFSFQSAQLEQVETALQLQLCLDLVPHRFLKPSRVGVAQTYRTGPRPHLRLYKAIPTQCYKSSAMWKHFAPS